MQKQEAETQFEQLIKANEILIHKVCRLYASTTAEREDLFQEIVIQFWKAYPKFKGDSKLSTWLYRVALNTAITGLRKRKNFIESREPDQLPEQVTEYDAEREEKLGQLYMAIEKLNQVEKAIVMLYMEDRTYEEMEEILGINQGNLRVKMNRIKDKLRQLTKNI